MITATDLLRYYAEPGPMTRLPDSRLLDALPTDAAELCRVSSGVIVHEMHARRYGVDDAEDRLEELENRRAADLVALIDRRDPQHRPLAMRRAPRRRVIGNCRQLTVLTCALLRHAGIPARARVGFASYFDDRWEDHWIVERWDASARRWVRSDPQLDENHRALLGYVFDPLDLPQGTFLTGAEAWLRCRRGEEDPAMFGIFQFRGWDLIAGNVLRDLAALHKVEVMPWDVWGVMREAPDEELIDAVAVAVVADGVDEMSRLYRRDGVRVPPVVRSLRFLRDVDLQLSTRELAGD
ncbi:transglutaminase-like domain-containing protein [Georgenia deserti]|uniref:Transglutaminase-like domain-containing protein n=1 Tax=Georgenia deserti TaxID=2093781 RepID=A0ABW4L5C5_9MICO